MSSLVESSWNLMAHGDAREGKWRGNWRMEWLASTLHTTSEHVVSSITTADAHTSAASCRLNWRPRRFKWTRPFRRKTKCGFCACAITFQTQSTLDAIQLFNNLRRPHYSHNCPSLTSVWSHFNPVTSWYLKVQSQYCPIVTSVWFYCIHLCWVSNIANSQIYALFVSSASSCCIWLIFFSN
jgi:hypothetical protein